MLVGCNKMDSKEAINKYKDLLKDNSMYTLTGEMDFVSNE
jgi:signal recognition particle receptor subunit beta